MFRTLIKLSVANFIIITVAIVIAPIIIIIAPETKTIISVMLSKVILLYNCLNYFFFVKTFCRSGLSNSSMSFRASRFNLLSLISMISYLILALINKKVTVYLTLRSRHRTTNSKVSNQCLDFQGHYQQLKINFKKNMSKLFYYNS